MEKQIDTTTSDITVEDVAKTTATVHEALTQYKDRTDGEIKELKEKLTPVVEQLGRMQQDLVNRNRISAFANDYSGEFAPPFERALTDGAPHARAMKGETLSNTDRAVLRFQELCDMIITGCMLCRVKGPLTEAKIRSTIPVNLWNQYSQIRTEFARAMDTATEVASFVPTEFSPRVLNQYYLALKVAAALNAIPMPHSPYQHPIMWARDSVVYAKGSEQTDANGTFNKWTHVGGTATHITMTAVKSIKRTVVSDEATWESIYPLIPMVQADHADFHAMCAEEALLNGDTTGTHMDSDITVATDFRKAWDGFRDIGLNGKTSGDFDAEATSFSTTNIRTARKGMGKYGVNPADLLLVTGISGYFALMLLAEVLTMEKYGQNATLLSGELARFDNVPVIVSEYIRHDLDANAVYNVAGTKTCAHFINKKCFLIGNREGIRTRYSDEVLMEYGAQVVVSDKRTAFNDIYAGVTDYDTVILRNISV